MFTYIQSTIYILQWHTICLYTWQAHKHTINNNNKYDLHTEIDLKSHTLKYRQPITNQWCSFTPRVDYEFSHRFLSVTWQDNYASTNLLMTLGPGRESTGTCLQRSISDDLLTHSQLTVTTGADSYLHHLSAINEQPLMELCGCF